MKKTFGLIGKKLGHSFSQTYFNNKFLALGYDDFSYKNFEINSSDELRMIVENDESIVGLNVTIPYKQDVLKHLDIIDETALEIGAVNTIKVIRSQGNISLQGFNTDAHGFQFSIKPFLNFHHQKALIFGTGGASKAVAYVFKKLGIDFLFVSRRSQNSNTILYNQLNEFAISNYKLIVNCTPIGMFPNVTEKLDLPYSAITSEHLCMDLIYNPTETEFLRQSKLNGAAILNGLSMLHLQADKAFEIFMK